jgi:hypothetical protein
MSKQFKIAALRAAGTSFIIAGLSALGLWSQTNDIKTIIIGTATPVLVSLAARFGVEGYVDTVKARK